VGDSIVIDMGARLDGYHSDLTRSFHVGTEPDDEFWRVYNLVLAAQTKALSEMRAGMTGKEIDALARDVIAEAGHKEHFGHSLGHGVGLEIHESPSLSWVTEREIPADCVVTVEPGVYVPEWGGVRIEDLVWLTAVGPELLSHCPKNPLIPV
jgi:Xaa-Pro aminopeptidase